MLGFKYLLLNPRSLPQTHVELFNRVYTQWADHWVQAEKQNEDFLHADHVGVLLCHNEIVGFHLLNYIDLRLKSSWQHQSLKTLSQLEHLQLQSHAPQTLLSQGSFFIAPEFTSANTEHENVDWAEVLLGLALKLLDDSKADLLMSIATDSTVTIHTKELRRRFPNYLTSRWVKLLWPLSETESVKTHSVQ